MKKVIAAPVVLDFEKKSGESVALDALQTSEVTAPPGSAPSLASLAAEAATLDAATATVGVDMGGGSLDEPSAPTPPIPSSELMRPLLDFAFGVYAPKWEVTRVEIDKLASAYGAVVDKYFPDGIAGKYALEINALLITFAVFQPRFKIAPRDVAKPDKTDDAATPAINPAELAPTIQ